MDFSLKPYRILGLIFLAMGSAILPFGFKETQNVQTALAVVSPGVLGAFLIFTEEEKMSRVLSLAACGFYLFCAILYWASFELSARMVLVIGALGLFILTLISLQFRRRIFEFYKGPFKNN